MEGPPIRRGSLDGRIPFGLSATVVSMILVSIMRFPWYTTDRVWVPENGTPQLLQYVLYIVLAWNSYSTWWEPLSMLRKAVAYIRASTLLGLIELGSHQLCLLAMVILVSILVLNQLPPIGGELGVQIAIPIWTRLTVIRSMGPVYYPVIVKIRPTPFNHATVRISCPWVRAAIEETTRGDQHGLLPIPCPTIPSKFIPLW